MDFNDSRRVNSRRAKTKSANCDAYSSFFQSCGTPFSVPQPELGMTKSILIRIFSSHSYILCEENAAANDIFVQYQSARRPLQIGAESPEDMFDRGDLPFQKQSLSISSYSLNISRISLTSLSVLSLIKSTVHSSLSATSAFRLSPFKYPIGLPLLSLRSFFSLKDLFPRELL